MSDEAAFAVISAFFVLEFVLLGVSKNVKKGGYFFAAGTLATVSGITLLIHHF